MANVLNYFDQADSDNDNVLNLNGTWKIDDVEVTASAAELNLANTSAQTETITAAGALSAANKVSQLALSGAGAVTLAVPDSTMLGQVKVIEMTADNGDITLSLSNVQGGSAATTATFDDVGDTLVLVGGVLKWNVCSETATLS